MAASQHEILGSEEFIYYMLAVYESKWHGAFVTTLGGHRAALYDERKRARSVFSAMYES
jgi:hypothetical protein